MDDPIDVGYINAVFGEGTLQRLRGFGEGPIEDDILDWLRRYHNPNGEPTGHYTGRCMRCHGDSLFVEMTVYGCEICYALFDISRLTPKIVMNRGVPETREIQAHNAGLEILLELERQQLRD